MTAPGLRHWARSLAGQMTLLVALALFVAQAINFGLLLRERRFFSVQQAAGQAATRAADALERLARGQPLERGRVRLAAANPVPATAPSEPEVEASLRATLADLGVPAGRIAIGIAPLAADDALLRRMPPGRERFMRDSADAMTIAIERPGLGWLVQRTLWVRRDASIAWRLAVQTLILFVVILLPVLWIGRRIARPLRDLTQAAHDFGRGEPVAVPVSGPRDVAVLIAAFNQLAARVTGMLDEKDRMLGAIGHDLRTPLAALRVRIESVEDETDRARMAETIAEMNRTLDDILSLARLGRPSEAATEVDLAALVDAVVEDFRDLDADVTFAETGRVRMRLRPSLMRRAVRNLIENAIKYAGGAEVSIEVAAQSVAILIRDSGPGIAADQLDAVFDAFTRLETSRNRETGGIGLGLALARTIVREAGGDITLANRAGGGLEARIMLVR